MNKAAAAADLGLGTVAALGVHLLWIRPRIFSWGATRDEASRPMAGDDLCPHPQCLLGIRQRAEQLAADRRRQ